MKEVYRMTREEAIQIIKSECYVFNPFNFDCPRMINTALDMAIETLEQEPKTGHWILTDVEGYRVWHCNCSECGKDPQDYIGGSEDWWLIKSKLPKFCPNCGAKMEVEE